MVSGGAGYIGSIVSKELVEAGHKVVIYDNLVKGHKSSIDPRCEFVEGDLEDGSFISKTLEKFNVNAVMHFAGFIEAGESMKNPHKFYKNNVSNGINLLEAMALKGVEKFIYSSSAGVYKSKNTPLKEEDPKEPSSVYGQTKLDFENALGWYSESHGINSTSLRYFNAFGNVGDLGEKHRPETHLIPLIFQAVLRKQSNIRIFGTDYKTPDGTCIRDYIHVRDLSRAHLLALDSLKEGANAYNVGTGRGNSVKEVIRAVEDVTNKSVSVVELKRRPGDPPILVADPTKIKKEFSWQSEVDFIDGLRENYDYFQRIYK